MSRLVTFGCSHTYGVGLKEPLKESWPSILGGLLNVKEVVNTSNPAASIKEISHKIHCFNFHSTDIAVILWTHLNRHCVVQGNDYRQINPWFAETDPLSKHYYENLHNTEDDRFQSLSFIISSDLVMQRQTRLTIHSFGDKVVCNLVKNYLHESTYFSKPFVHGYRHYGMTDDGTHLGSLSNSVFAKEIYYFIQGGRSIEVY